MVFDTLRYGNVPLLNMLEELDPHEVQQSPKKVPSIDQSGGFIESSDFVHLVKGRITFYDDSEVMKHQLNNFKIEMEERTNMFEEITVNYSNAEETTSIHGLLLEMVFKKNPIIFERKLNLWQQ
ncbi:hypothetical protein AgCh_038060 [Apium graveolens]